LWVEFRLFPQACGGWIFRPAFGDDFPAILRRVRQSDAVSKIDECHDERRDRTICDSAGDSSALNSITVATLTGNPSDFKVV
jgi:hypothetical protein